MYSDYDRCISSITLSLHMYHKRKVESTIQSPSSMFCWGFQGLAEGDTSLEPSIASPRIIPLGSGLACRLGLHFTSTYRGKATYSAHTFAGRGS